MSNTKSTHMHETRTMNNGLKATIIAYRNCNDIDVQFDEGHVSKNRTYADFKKGHIAHPKIATPYNSTAKQKNASKRMHETRTMNNGLKATIIAYRSALDIDVQFDDVHVSKNRTYDNFKKGHIAHPKIATPYNSTAKQKNASKRMHETRTMNNGLKATIIAYRSCEDIDIQFENDTIKEHVTYGNFKKGAVNI